MQVFTRYCSPTTIPVPDCSLPSNGVGPALTETLAETHGNSYGSGFPRGTVLKPQYQTSGSSRTVFGETVPHHRMISLANCSPTTIVRALNFFPQSLIRKGTGSLGAARTKTGGVDLRPKLYQGERETRKKVLARPRLSGLFWPGRSSSCFAFMRGR